MRKPAPGSMGSPPYTGRSGASVIVAAPPGLKPENTLRSIEAALKLGVEMVEIDVRPCADGTLVVIHDDDLDRTAHAQGRVSQSTLGSSRASM